MKKQTNKQVKIAKEILEKVRTESPDYKRKIRKQKLEKLNNL